MPGIAHKINTHTDHSITKNYQNQLAGNGMVPFHSFDGSSVSSNGFWLKHRDDVSLNHLRKFWCELTPQARHKLLRVDKQTLFEHARKNMYCSRCNGLLREGFLQIGMYGKSLKQDVAGMRCSVSVTNNQNDDDLCMETGCQDDAQDPSILPWGGLTTARDGTLTLLDCYLCSKSLTALQNVFHSSRAREREREMLYPDACGGGGQGWISQGTAGYGRGHGTRETCALHTARLSVETLVAFWSALGEDTQQSLLRMKEDDFVERLMYRFDRKRFCRDCRRNVIREFKELKELKRMRREPRCTSWFCAADTAFQYEVSLDTVQADWHQTFLDAFGEFHHYEWAIGAGEGKSDIMEFENVGLSEKAQLDGLDLSGMNACYITLRTWKMDGRCNELCVKAHALQGQKCVHCRLIVGDGFVTMTTGESIRRFLEHAEEAEEEEDDDSMDKDGNELDGDYSHPQKHAKSPELAREFLLDAATVIFKEQVEKAFREGTARQNAHSMFVCLALKLLEEHLHVACKEIITLEKQTKLLEEEEKEKREEEERKERRKTKEREKKLRRKERLRGKEKRENKCGAEASVDPVVPDILKEETMLCVDEEANVIGSREFVCETGEATPASLLPPNIHGDPLLMEYMYSNMVNHSEDSPVGEFSKRRDWNPSFLNDRIKYSHRKLRFHKDPKQDLSFKRSDRKIGASMSENGVIISNFESRRHADVFESSRSINGCKKQLRINVAKSNIRNGGPTFSEEFQCTNNRIGDRYDSHACSCNHHNENRSRSESQIKKVVQEPKSDIKFMSPLDTSTPYYLGNGNKYPQVERTHEVKGQPKNKIIARPPPNIKKVWEPLDSRRKHTRSNSDFDVDLRSPPKVEAAQSDQLPESFAATSSDEVTYSVQTNSEDDSRGFTESGAENCRNQENAFHAIEKSQQCSKETSAEGGKLCSMTRSPRGTLESSITCPSNFDNCSSCLSEGDSNISSSNSPIMESDSEEASQNSEGKETSCCLEIRFTDCHRVEMDPSTARGQASKTQGPDSAGTISSSSMPAEAAPYYANRRANVSLSAAPQNSLPQYAVFHAPIVGHYHQNSVSWRAGPTNGLMPFPHTNHYLFPSSFGFGLNGNARFIQCGTLQHLAPPLLNPVHLPVFQPVAPINGVTAKVHAKVADLSGLKEGQGTIQDMAATNQHPAERPTVVDVSQNEKSDKEDMGNHGFSLFHFGGPVALSAGFKADAVSLREGLTQHTSSNLSVTCSHGDQFCNKKDAIEEYNLFASSNALKFSFF